MPITVVNNNSLVSTLQQTNPITINLPSAVDMSSVALQAAESAQAAQADAEQARDETITAAEFRAPSMSDFLSRSDVTLVGSRWRIDTGEAFDVVIAGSGDYNHPVSGVDLSVVPVLGGIYCATAFGVVENSAADATENAIALNIAGQVAIANRSVLFIGGDVYIDDTFIFRSNSGRGLSAEAGLPEAGHLELASGARIIMTANNKPCVVLRGRGLVVPKLLATYVDFQDSTNTASIAIALHDVSGSVMGHLFGWNGYKGVATDRQGDSADWFYDNTIDRIEAYRYSGRGVEISPYAAGNTPSFIGTITARAPWVSGSKTLSLVNSSGDTRYFQEGIASHVRLKGTQGLVVSAINIEAAAASSALLEVNDCPGSQIAAFYTEVSLLSAAYSTMIEVSNGAVNIGAVGCYDVDFGSTTSGLAAAATSTSIAKLNGGKSRIGPIKLSGKYIAGGSGVAAIRSSETGHEVGEIDAAELSSGNPGTTFVGSNGKATYVYGGPNPHDPVIARYANHDVPMRFEAVGSGSTVVSTAGILILPESANPDADACAMYDASTGQVTIPSAGWYSFSAQVIGNTGYTARYAIRKNGTNQVVWEDNKTSASPIVAERGWEAYLVAGDVIDLYLISGQCITSNASRFTGRKIS